MESEAIASAKGGEIIAYVREVLRAFGVPLTEPTLLGTDNLSNLKIATGVGCPTRSRHFLRRYAVLRQRLAEGEVVMAHVRDEHMSADFLTKWSTGSKAKRSIRYVTNTWPGPEASSSILETISLETLRQEVAALADDTMA